MSKKDGNTEKGEPKNTPAPNMVQQPQQYGYLSSEEFEKLKNSIQLLRISQIRYIVQKYKLPANGNKNKLLKLILEILETLRPTQILLQISADVNRLLATQNEPFTNPLEETFNKMQLAPQNIEYNYATNPFVNKIEQIAIVGPLLASPGRNAFHCTIPAVPALQHNVQVMFAWPSKEVVSFELSGEINGFPIYVLSDDPRPAPLDVTDIVIPGKPLQVTLSVKTPVPLIISISEVVIQTVQQIAAAIGVSANLDCEPFEIMALGNECTHTETFSLVKFLSACFATGKSVCPLCGNEVHIEHMKFSSPPKAAEETK